MLYSVWFSHQVFDGVCWCYIVPETWPISCAIWEPYLPWQDMNPPTSQEHQRQRGVIVRQWGLKSSHTTEIGFVEPEWQALWNYRTENGEVLFLEPAVWDSQESGWEWRSCQKLTVHSFPQVRWSSCFQELYWQRSTRTYGCQPWGCGWRPRGGNLFVHLCYFLNGFPQN